MNFAARRGAFRRGCGRVRLGLVGLGQARQGMETGRLVATGVRGSGARVGQGTVRQCWASPGRARLGPTWRGEARLAAVIPGVAAARCGLARCSAARTWRGGVGSGVGRARLAEACTGRRGFGRGEWHTSGFESRALARHGEVRSGGPRLAPARPGVDWQGMEQRIVHEETSW